mmetsp:Transcript_89619/g.214206  ORF Transcript_89619/g.214206 Transcript_89619/m.214206 type:complete len:202 (-) Transcript_89619:1078-1683(-)
MSSKPSAASGRENLVKLVFSTVCGTSGTASFRKVDFCSSGVSFTFGGSSSASISSTSSSSSSSTSSSISTSFSSSSSSGSSFPSASAFFFSASFLAFSCAFFISAIFFNRSFSAFFLAFSASLAFFSMARLRASSSFCFLNSRSAFSCLSFSISSKDFFLKSAEGSPMTTQAFFLKQLSKKRARPSARFSLMRLPRTSITT